MAKRWWGWAVALAVGLLAGLSVRPAMADPLSEAKAFEAEVEKGCLKDLDPAVLSQRAAALKAAFATDPRALYAAAPTALLAAARLARVAHDFARARQDYRAITANLPDDQLGHQLAKAELKAIDREEAALAQGLAPPASGWVLFDRRDLVLPGIHRAAWAIWTGPDCRVDYVSDGPHQLQLYVQVTPDRPMAPAGEPVAEEAVLIASEDGTNYDVTNGAATIIAVTQSRGGNCWACEWLRLFRAELDGLHELPPPETDFIIPRTVGEIRAAGPLALIASDDRWEELGDVCHACSAGTRYFYLWQNGRFVEACSEAVATYVSSRADDAAGLAKEEDVDFAFGYAASRLLDGLQLGEIDRAWREFETDLRRVRALPKAKPDAFAAVERLLREAIDRSRPAMAGRGCPLLGLKLSPD